MDASNSLAAAGVDAPSRAQRKQQERAAESLAFLNRIARIRVTRTSFVDEHEQIHFDVIMKADATPPGSGTKPLKSARAVRKEARAILPMVDYSNKKSLSTLKGIHTAVHQWSARHPEAVALDGTSRCAYCSRFNSPTALQLWKWYEPQTQQQQGATQGVALTVVSSRSNNVLLKYEKCLNSYLVCARAVASPDESSADEPQCEGRAHIPSLLASFLQNEDATSVAVSVALFSCLVM
ncbi:hypothetical protein Gpo141_00001267 [Globisporangium polare]